MVHHFEQLPREQLHQRASRKQDHNEELMTMTTLIHLPSRRVKNPKMEVKSHVPKEIILLQLHNQECQRGMTGEGQYEVEVMIQYSCEKKEQEKQDTADHRASRHR